MIKPSNYDNRNVIIKPTNNYDNKQVVLKPSSNYDNKPKPNYHYNYGGGVQPSSNQQNQPGQNRFLQAVRPSSGVQKVVKR